ncbi:MAG: 16S rRNA (cytosine(1402)-N(4))-methyltransferase RsmH [Fidelibacterota bacterium]|nr:MAG: 16S rRNA (cytosine(1402)-N(4))-methyltransferase RsmH [Candidatus Neomarinimicrobiota bacterium]
MSGLIQGISHTPVMVDEVLDWLVTTPDGWYVDGTVGTGGHTAGILSRLSLKGRVLGIDLDAGSLAVARDHLAADLRVVLRQGSYAQTALFLQELAVKECQGVLLDLGLSSFSLEASGRGFSYQSDEPLDMRFDSSHGRPLHQVLLHMTPEALAGILTRYGEERQARAIAQAIHNEAAAGRLTTSRELAETVRTVAKGPLADRSLARVFQALRIFINDELNMLQATLERLNGLLESGRRAIIISYHSLEDRLVKQFFARESKDCLCPTYFPQCICGHTASFKVLTRKPITPSSEEIALNPRSRSAKLRIAERL